VIRSARCCRRKAPPHDIEQRLFGKPEVGQAAAGINSNGDERWDHADISSIQGGYFLKSYHK
jgi:hypothetical protein